MGTLGDILRLYPSELKPEVRIRETINLVFNSQQPGQAIHRAKKGRTHVSEQDLQSLHYQVMVALTAALYMQWGCTFASLRLIRRDHVNALLCQGLVCPQSIVRAACPWALSLPVLTPPERARLLAQRSALGGRGGKERAGDLNRLVPLISDRSRWSSPSCLLIH